jgi:meso-butanediol dehydrogenase/(S,S)-butanediol dehydrogenase/diacetyl reductase
MTGLTGKVAVVTGGGRGIGRAIVEQLASAGANVVTCGRGERPIDLAESVGWLTIDVARPDMVNSLRANVEKDFGVATILVNNAGVQIEKTVTESGDDDWDAVVGANCRGVFNCCRAFIPSMEAAGGGAVVNIGSISGMVADPGLALYNASKAFVHGLTRSIAVDHGPAVRCNAIRPGWIITGMADAAFAVSDNVALAKRDALSRHAAGRFGKPNDIAAAALWLVSDDAAFVTGQCITVDGGLTAASPIQPGLF